MRKLYLMSAHHINGFRNITINRIAKQEPNVEIAVYSYRNGTKFLFATGYIGEYKLGEVYTHINDTGNGYRQVNWKDEELTLVNVVVVRNGEVVSKENDICISTAHSLKVYK